MSYDFNSYKKPNKKHVFNKQEKRDNTKLDTKQKKINQKGIVSKQLQKEISSQIEKGNDTSITWNDIIVSDEKKIEEGYVAGKA
jgi:hypothetical protein